jgi:tetratricopeptide (TPR) repeat protein
VCGLLCGVASAVPAGAQSDDMAQQQDYSTVYASHVNSKIGATTIAVNRNKGILNNRAGELLDEISTRLSDAMATLPAALRNSFGDRALPMPASIQRLNEFDKILASDVYQISLAIDSDVERMSQNRDSLEYGSKAAPAALVMVEALAGNVQTNLNLWQAKIDLIRQRLIRDGTPDQARRMFAREYNTIAQHYQSGNYGVMLVRLDVLTEPYGDFVLREWTESLLFYRAEALYAMGDWENAFKYYQTTWQDQGNLYAAIALLNWTELAFAAGYHEQVATMWVAGPRIPDDIISANRMRLLVTESFLRLGDWQSSLSALNTFVKTADLDQEQTDAFALAQIQSGNIRLEIYADLLRAEAHAATAFLKPADIPGQESASSSARAETRDNSDLLGDLGIALSGLGEVEQRAGQDSLSRLGTLAYQIAEGSVIPATRDFRPLERIITDLENLVPRVRLVEADGPLMARVLMALGHSYFERTWYTDASAAFAAIPSSSRWYPEAQISRAWAELEQGEYLESMASLNLARRFLLSPSLALEASALNAYLLRNMGQTEQSDEQIRRMMMSVSLEERRSVQSDIALEIDKLKNTLDLVGVIAMEREMPALYTDVLSGRRKLGDLVTTNREVQTYLGQHAAGHLESDSVEIARSIIRRERTLVSQLKRSTRDLRRRAGRVPQKSGIPDATVDQRRTRLDRWLAGLQPDDRRQGPSIYQQWSEYAEFAYAKQLFEDSLRRKSESARLKDERSRIKRLLQESP